MSRKSWSRLAAFGLMVCTYGLANADEVTFTGTTAGAFNGGSFATTDTLLGLVYTSSTFNNTTVGGQLDLGGNSSPGSDFNNLGSFTLDTADNNYAGNNFSVEVTFTSPTGITGGSSVVFTDLITGSVSSTSGGVFVDFDNTPQLFTFNDGNINGSFSMFVNDLSLAPGQSVSITAHIEGNQAPVPEPASMAAIGFGIVGIIGRRRRNRK